MTRSTLVVALLVGISLTACASGDECVSAAECASGMCLNGHCLADDAGSASEDAGLRFDAGADAAVRVDASVDASDRLDASADAGRDAAVLDAGRDGGSDAGADAGQDAGRDAGRDAGVPDAGRDAGSGDAGGADAGRIPGCSFYPVTACPASGRIADFCGAGGTVGQLRRCDMTLFTPTPMYLTFDLCACGCTCPTGVVWSQVECCY